MPTIFIAVQCFQCSTMQVKQQKKSSNKWNCVICNEKQSIRKVFSQGFLAKDVRKFVQGFNMSRQLVEANQDETLTPPSEQINDPSFRNTSSNAYQNKKRRDWTEYLDPENDYDHQDEEKESSILEAEFVTELPKEIFKKPRLKNYSAGLDNVVQQSKLLKPVFSKRGIKQPIILQDNEKLRKCKPTMSKTTSKWSNYLTEDDDELLFGGKATDFTKPLEYDLETQINGAKVEDEVHPDFQ